MYGVQCINTLVTARDRGDYLIFGNLDYKVGPHLLFNAGRLLSMTFTVR